jgi:hypothetical protein
VPDYQENVVFRLQRRTHDTPNEQMFDVSLVSVGGLG